MAQRVDNPTTGKGITGLTSGVDGGPHRGAPRQSQPCGPHVVAYLAPPPARLIADSRRLVMRDHAIDIHELPAGGRERECERSLFASDAVARGKTPSRQERRTTHHRAAGDEAEYRRSRETVTTTEWTGCHGMTGGIDAPHRLDDDASTGDRYLRMGVEDVRRR